MAKKSKKKTSRRGGITAKTVQLQLRSTIDELERGKCVLASKRLIDAAHTLGVTAKRKNARMVKARAHFTEVAKFFERTCVKGGPELNRFAQSGPRRPGVPPPGYDMSYQAGPRHPLPGRRPDVHPVQATPYRGMPHPYGAPQAHAHVHTHPFIDGLGGLGNGYRVDRFVSHGKPPGPFSTTRRLAKKNLTEQEAHAFVNAQRYPQKFEIRPRPTRTPRRR